MGVSMAQGITIFQPHLSHGLGHGSYIKAPNSGTQQPLATWEIGPASKDPHFISAFEIKTLCANCQWHLLQFRKDEENTSLKTPTLSFDADVWD